MDNDEMMLVYRISSEWFGGSPIILDSVKAVRDFLEGEKENLDEQGDMEAATEDMKQIEERVISHPIETRPAYKGQAYSVEVIEMTRAAFDALPEWDGWN